jgi:hypothetical protein
MTAEPLSTDELWAKTVDQVKDRVNNRSFWESLESAVAITIENDTLIIGMNARIFNQAGHLTVSDHKNAIQVVASRLAGRKLTIRVIEGDTLEDWNYTKKREERVAAMKASTYERKDREEAESQSWDALHDYVSRSYSALHLRQLPQIKARYLTDMLYVIADAMEKLYPEQPDDSAERHLARVIDKVAGSAEVPSTIVALELERMRQWRQQPG